MNNGRYSDDELVRLGQLHYERELRHLVEPQSNGMFLVLDVRSGDYEVDAVDASAALRLKARRPLAQRYILRIGHPTGYRMGARVQAPHG